VTQILVDFVRCQEAYGKLKEVVDVLESVTLLFITVAPPLPLLPDGMCGWDGAIKLDVCDAE
jgi:hypothetical protein